MRRNTSARLAFAAVLGVSFSALAGAQQDTGVVTPANINSPSPASVTEAHIIPIGESLWAIGPAKYRNTNINALP